MNNKTYFKNQSRMGKITAGIIGIISLFYMISCSSEIDVVPFTSAVEDPQVMLSSTNGVTGNPTSPSAIESLKVIEDPHYSYENGFILKTLTWDFPTNMGTTDGTTPATLAGLVIKYKTGDSDFIEIDENSDGGRLSIEMDWDNTVAWISGLIPNSSYTFLVAASNSAGLVTPDADAATVTTTTGPPPTMSFQIVSAISNQLVFSWHFPSAKPEYQYDIFFKKPKDRYFYIIDPVKEGVRLSEEIGTNTTITVLGLSPATEYIFGVRARDSERNNKAPHMLIEYTTALEDSTPPSSVENLVLFRDPFFYQNENNFVYQNGLIAHQLLWDAPTDRGTIDGTTPATLAGYVVKYKTEDSDFVEIDENSYGVRLTKRIGANDNSTWIAGLSLNTRYTFLVAAKNSAGMLTPNAGAAIVTTTPVPPPPTDLQVVPSTNSHPVVLSWYHPSANSDYHYYVNFKKPGDSYFKVLYVGTNTTATLRGLSPATKYTFRVDTYAYREDVWSPRVEIKYTTASEEATPPSPVESLGLLRDPFIYQDENDFPFIYQNGFIAHQLLWDPPTDMGTIDGSTPATLAGYVVKYKTEDSDFIEIDENSEGIRLLEKIGVNSTNTWISGLSLNTKYIFLVAAYNSVGMVAPDVDAVTVTTVPVPPPPMNLQIDSSTSSFTHSEVSLSWHPSSTNSHYHYYLYYKKEGDRHFTGFPVSMNSTATVRGLIPSTKYTFRVRAYGQEPLWSPLIQIEHTTAPEDATPPSPVESLILLRDPFVYQNVRGFPFIYENGFIAHQLLWDEPTHIGTIHGNIPATLAGYVVKYRTEDSDFIEINEKSEGVRLTRRISANNKSIWISGLSLSTRYTFLVAASNSAGMVTPDADAATVTTVPVPPPPTNLQVVSSTDSEVTLSWNPPSTNSYHHYYFFYKKEGDKYFANFSVGTNTTTKMTGLTPSTKYTFQVRTYGQEPLWSPLIQIEHTTAAHEDAIHPSPVGNLQWIPSSNNQAQLTWTAPTNTGNIDGVTPATIIGYSVWYKETEDSSEAGDSGFSRIDENSQGIRLAAALTGTSTNATITGLSPGLTYIFSVVAKNLYGEVSYTNQDTQIKQTLIPLAPPALLRGDICRNYRVDLSWDRSPGATYYKISRNFIWIQKKTIFPKDRGPYEVVTKKEDKALKRTTTNSYIDSSLFPSTAYTYRVQACNSSGCSDFSPSLTTATTSIHEYVEFYGVVKRGIVPMYASVYDRKVNDVFAFYKPYATLVARYVKVGGTGDGSSFAKAAGNPQTVLNNIQDASEDKVYVIFLIGGKYGGPQPYTPDTISMKPYVAIVGGVDDCLGKVDDPVTTLDGQGSRRLFYVEGGGITHNAPAVLYGVNLVNGSTRVGRGSGRGGGMYIKDASPILSKVTFSKNKAYHGGGLSIENSDPLLVNVTFSGNTTFRGNGGGMASFLSSPMIIGTTFTENRSYGYGGAMFNDNHNKPGPHIINSIFWQNNSSLGYGGHQITIWNSDNGVERLNIFNSIVQEGAGNIVSGKVYTGEPSIHNGISFPNSGSVQIWFQTILNQDPGLAVLGYNGGLVLNHPISSSGPAVNRGLYIKWEKGNPSRRYYFSPDNARWFDTAMLTNMVTLPKNTVYINLADATDYNRLRRGKPDIGAYEGR